MTITVELPFKKRTVPLWIWRTATPWRGPILVAIAYYLGAETAFFIGTLSDKIFALFWPPNVILFCALLITPHRTWWRYIACAIPAHVIAELGVGMPLAQLTVAFTTNCLVALLNAYGVRRAVGDPPWFGTFQKAGRYMVIAGLLSPAIAALGGAFVPILGGGSISDYWFFWALWILANALPNLTIGPVFLIWFSHRHIWLKWQFARSQIEPTVLAVALVGACLLIAMAVGRVPHEFLVALLFLTLPLTLWAAVRFGEKGASATILILTVILTWRTLRGPALFEDLTPERSVLALQLFLIALSVPVLLLGAVIDDLRGAERRTRGLAARLLTAQDEERRRIARELHDSTGQNLIAATLLTGQVQRLLPAAIEPIMLKLDELLQQSIREIRTVSYLLHPPFLDEDGLALALREYTDGFAARSNIEVDLNIAADLGKLSGDIELALFRIVQEALTNVARHSESKTARIDLARAGSAGRRHVVLMIEDKGKGMPAIGPRRLIGFANKPGTSQGVGLASMRERVRQIGGRIEIDSTAGRTVVRALVPIRN